MSKLHECGTYLLPNRGYGSAVTDCDEDEDGSLWASNDEYSTQVMFCPFCGMKAKTWPPKPETELGRMRRLHPTTDYVQRMDGKPDVSAEKLDWLYADRETKDNG